jgi:predicted Holliday junction resolvase-like endonuclease
MNPFRYWKIALCLLALAGVSGLVGGFIGLRMAKQRLEQRDNPESWNESAMRTFERTVNPTAEQRVKIQGFLEQAVDDLKAIRADAISRSTNVVWKLVGEVEKELAPEQKAAFDKMKPSQQDVTSLEVLRVEKKP